MAHEFDSTSRNGLLRCLPGTSALNLISNFMRLHNSIFLVILTFLLSACGGGENSADMSATEVGVVSLTVSPSVATLTEGHTLQFVATAIYSDGSNRDLSEEVTWNSLDTGVITVSNAMGSRGLATAVALGTAMVTASWSGLVDSANIVVTDSTGPLKVSLINPRYFTDTSGRAIYLTGSHTWANLQDNGQTDPPAKFDYDAYLDFLKANNHNFFRLWTWEQADRSAEIVGDYWFDPMPYQRTGPGTALDGKPKFDLTRFNQVYFDRLRKRVVEAGKRAIYVSVMLFNGWSIEDKDWGKGNPWPGHPYHRDNNINGIDGDPNGDGEGKEVHTLQIAAVTALQEAYVRKIIDTVNDLDNVLYEVSNESHSDSQDWQYHMVNYIKDYEAGKVKQHPVGMTVEWPDGDNNELYASAADWISPNGDVYQNNPPVANGQKVIILDTDHFSTQTVAKNGPSWVWKSFLRGHNPIFMDQYDSAGIGVGANPDIAGDDSRWVAFRRNMGYALDYAQRINLVAMEPRGDLSSTGYCLANAVAGAAEYLVYLPSGGKVTMDLSATPGQLSVEWFRPDTGTTIKGASTTGGVTQSFIAPFTGDAVLYLSRD